jgi:hypothetical protein
LDDVGSPTEFPQLSQAFLRTVTAQALRKVPPFFPGEPLDDCDVLDYYERICDFGKDLENIGDEQEKQLMELGLSRTRRRSLMDNLDALGKLYAGRELMRSLLTGASHKVELSLHKSHGALRSLEAD